MRTLGSTRILAAVLSGCVGVLVAVAGGGVWALVVESLSRAATSSILLVLAAGWLPRAVFDRDSLRRLWSFGRHMTVSNLLNYGIRNIDNLLVGRFLGRNVGSGFTHSVIRG